ncbi:hypothetical protein RN001_011411 [Aquatica leii]|uniref:Tesmin/TSO1-like CXC domain-containing protein n=1 Tax=Aquatica leii TaxID=1421715 RepID=A0AAN7P1G2_9COLE|nr:hypothetical protein RN001_011411 [Aquatica leii]
MCPDITFNEETCVNTLQTDFLSNKKNKACLISMVSNFLKMGGVNVDQAQDDADELIVSTALRLHQLNKKVVILATDTDILTILIARAPTDNNILVLHPATNKTTAQVFVVDDIQKNIGVMKEAVLFAHAVSGCDKTSALYNKGKKSSYNLLQKSKSLREKVCRIFNKPNQRKNEVVAVGEEFVRALYPDGQEFSNINQLRHHLYNRMMVKQSAASLMDLSNLPPTKAATKQHSLRVYVQVQEWLGNSYPPTEWGWKLIQDQLFSIPTTLPFAPESLLRLIHCQCNSNCDGRCSCWNSGQKCSILCATCKGEICTNTDI